MTRDEKAAAILIESGYATFTGVIKNPRGDEAERVIVAWQHGATEDVDYTSGTLEGRRQLDIIWDWFSENHISILNDAKIKTKTPGDLKKQAENSVIMYCLEVLDES